VLEKRESLSGLVNSKLCSYLTLRSLMKKQKKRTSTRQLNRRRLTSKSYSQPCRNYFKNAA
jgi:hypothetical protein